MLTETAKIMSPIIIPALEVASALKKTEVMPVARYNKLPPTMRQQRPVGRFAFVSGEWKLVELTK